MRNKLLYCSLSAFAFLLFPVFAKAQINIPASGVVSENFNSLGASSSAALPTGWKMSPAGTVADGQVLGRIKEFFIK